MKRLSLSLSLCLSFFACDDPASIDLNVDDPLEAGVTAEAGVDARPPADAEADGALPDDAQTPEDRGVEAPLEPLDREGALQAVEVLIGTGGAGFGYASMSPAVQVPNGMVRLGPDTTNRGVHLPQQHFSGYNDMDPHIRGFAHTHFIGTGAAGYGHLRVRPAGSLPDETPWAGFSTFDRESTEAWPGHYAVTLTEPNVRVRLSATRNAGIHHYSFEAGGGWLLVDAAARLSDSATLAATLEATPSGVNGDILHTAGYTGRGGPYPIHFSARADPPPVEAVPWMGEGEAGMALRFEAAEVTLRVGLSFVDAAQANAHAGTLEDRSVQEVADEAWEAWLEKAQLARVGGGTEAQRRVFHTAQYNVYRMPTRTDGLDGRYRGLDGQTHESTHPYYTDLSLWDTFRTLHPWLALTDPRVQRDCLNSMLRMAADGGFVPRWPAGSSYTGGMIGTSADVVFADSALKGVDGVDYAAAFTALRLTAEGPTPQGARFAGRHGIEQYIQLGYVPYESHEQAASLTLEYAYDDAALAHLGVHVGQPELAAVFRLRGDNWSNLFSEGFMRNRRADGSFVELPDPASGWGMQYTEGTAWHWAFYAPQNPEGLREAFGGPAALGAALDEFFESSRLINPGDPNTAVPDAYYWHGNEPDLHAAYLYAWTDRAHRGDHWLREIQTRLYDDTPAGIPGNDDGGTLSAWYLFSALGFYPFAGTPTYVLGAPLFPVGELQFGDHVLRVEAPGASAELRYLKSVTLDGEPLQRIVTHEQLAAGRLLRFELTADPMEAM